jgi:hypothetical protein
MKPILLLLARPSTALSPKLIDQVFGKVGRDQRDRESRERAFRRTPT